MSANALTAAFAKAAEAVLAARRTAIITHERADGDAIGCVVAVQEVLRSRGRAAEGMLFEPPTSRYAWLTASSPLPVWPSPQAAAALDEADLWLVVDTAARAQLTPLTARLAARRARLVVIDHHRSADLSSDLLVSDESAAATALLIAEWCESGGWALPPGAALALFVGMATDTGWFRHSNTDARVLRAAARLVEQGVAASEVYERLYLAESRERFALFAGACGAASFEADGQIAVMEVSRELLRRCGADAGQTEDLVNEPMRVGTVRVSLLLVEAADGMVRVSLRSKDTIDVAALARAFGGGGHARAAGARLAGTLPQVRSAVVAAVRTALEGAAAGGGVSE